MKYYVPAIICCNMWSYIIEQNKLLNMLRTGAVQILLREAAKERQ
jgi:hypothetical protein